MKFNILKNSSLSSFRQQIERSVNYFVQKSENNKLLTFVSDYFDFLPSVQIAYIKKVPNVLQLKNSKNIGNLQTETVTQLNELFFNIENRDGRYFICSAEKYLPIVLNDGFYFVEVNIGNSTILISEIFEVCGANDVAQASIVCNNPRMVSTPIDYAQQTTTRPTFKIDFLETMGLAGTFFTEITWFFAPQQTFDNLILNFIVLSDNLLSSYIDKQYTVSGDGSVVIAGETTAIDGDGTVTLTSVLPSAFLLYAGTYSVRYTTNTGCTGEVEFVISKDCFDCADGALVLSKSYEDNFIVKILATYTIPYSCTETIPTINFNFVDNNGLSFGDYAITPAVVGFDYQYIKEVTITKLNNSTLRKVICNVYGDCNISGEITIETELTEIENITINAYVQSISGNCAASPNTFNMTVIVEVTNNSVVSKTIKSEFLNLYSAIETKILAAGETKSFGAIFVNNNYCIADVQIKLTEIETSNITNLRLSI